LPQIEVMHYHRHGDNPHEGGLNLGLRAHEPAEPDGLGARRAIGDVFRTAGTPGEEAAFGFALGVIGAPDWGRRRRCARWRSEGQNARLRSEANPGKEWPPWIPSITKSSTLPA